MSATDAFLERLLELMPIYTESGRQLARLLPSMPPASAADLAARARRRWPSDAHSLEVLSRAAAEGRDTDVGRAAADTLFACRARGADYVVAEARAAVGAPDRP
jgi:hypothetical protein